MPIMRRAAAFLLFSIAAARLHAANFVDSKYDVRVVRNLAYGADREQRLDLYEPAGPRSPKVRPAFIAIHGGGWRHGTKDSENLTQLCEELAASGFVCLSIDHRLTGVMNDAADDAKRALTWMIANANKYRVDPARIAIGGSSSGAITALHLVYTRGERRVRAVFSWVGRFDGDLKNVTAAGPPLFLVAGTADRAIPVERPRALVRRAREAGLTHEAWICADLEHMAPLDRRPLGISLYDHLGHFLYRTMDLAKLATDPLPKLGATGHGDPVACPH